MIIHIVRDNETISDILRNYNISIDDLKTNNLHVTDFKHLTPGMKLRIPDLNQETIQILNEVEPLVSNYYKPNFEEEKVNDEPKISDDNKENNHFRPRSFNLFMPRGLNNPFKGQIYPHFIKKQKNNN